VGGSHSRDGDRRRSPRFTCAGRATIRCLPFDGKSVSGTLRDLSAGGICLDVAQPVESGARTEIIVYANAASFRAAALVTGQRARGTSLQFLQISSRGQDVLADLLQQLARVQALNRKLRSARIDEETEQILTERGGFSFLMIDEQGKANAKLLLRGADPIAGRSKDGTEREEEDSGLIQVDLFG
jgi:c-di-GMP-binding flagellar brake protein YcgR